MANTILVNDSDKYFEQAAKDRYSDLKQTLSVKIEGACTPHRKR
jgi:hypothetical protein